MSNVPTNLIPTRFSDLPQAETVNAEDRMVILQNGNNKTATLGQYANIPAQSSFVVVNVDSNLPNDRALAVGLEVNRRPIPFLGLSVSIFSNSFTNA